MSLNPFIEVVKDPIGTFAMLGYALFLLGLLVITLGTVWDNALTAYIEARKNWNRWNYVFPLRWTARVAAICLVLAIDAWAVSALIWMLA